MLWTIANNVETALLYFCSWDSLAQLLLPSTENHMLQDSSSYSLLLKSLGNTHLSSPYFHPLLSTARPGFETVFIFRSLIGAAFSGCLFAFSWFCFSPRL